MKRKIVGIFVCMLMIATVFPVTGVLNDQTEWSVKDNPYSEPLSPGLITIVIVARVDHVYDPSNLLGGAIQSNDLMIGKYAYDSGVPDSNPDPTEGWYNFTSSSCGIELRAGGFVFKTNPSDVQFRMVIRNDYGTPPADYYALGSAENLQLSNGAKIVDFTWGIVDPTGTSLSTDALPTTAPLVNANWIANPGLWITGFIPDPYGMFFIRANVTRAIKSNTIDVSETENNQDISSVMIPYSYSFLQFWVNVFQRFPNAFPILQHLMGY